MVGAKSRNNLAIIRQLKGLYLECNMTKNATSFHIPTESRKAVISSGEWKQ